MIFIPLGSIPISHRILLLVRNVLQPYTLSDRILLIFMVNEKRENLICAFFSIEIDLTHV